jgi:hypothetical protein
MCDYSLQNIRSRAAKVGDKLMTVDFFSGTRGFASQDDLSTAVCVLPGTELAFAGEIRRSDMPILSWIKERLGKSPKTQHRTAIFRQINKEIAATHHDALELPDGQVMLLTRLRPGQKATVLQLPAQPRAPDEVKPQEAAQNFT